MPIVSLEPSRVLVFRDPSLFRWRTVRDNVAVGLQVQGALRTRTAADAQAHIDVALELIGRPKFAHARQHLLSRGMAQRAGSSTIPLCLHSTNRSASSIRSRRSACRRMW